MKDETDLIADRMWVLSVLTGHHQGAGCQIRQGSNLLGSEQDCQIVLSDPGIEPEHLLIVRKAGYLSIHCLSAGVAIAGQPLKPGDAVTVSQASLLSIGSVTLGIGPGQTDWQRFVTDKTRAEPRVQGSAGESTAGKRTARASILLRRWLTPPVSAALVGLGTFFLLVWLVGPGNQHGLAADQPDPAAVMEQLAKRMESLGLPEVVLEKTRSDIRVAGYVANKRELQMLTAAVADLKPVMSVFVVSELERFIADRIRGVGSDTRTRYLGEGVIEVSGTDAPDGALARILADIQTEVPGLNQVRQSITDYTRRSVAPLPAAADEPLVLSGVNGVNTGHRSPHLSSGKNYIFPGGVLRNGMSVIAIEGSRVLVDDRGSQKASTINAR